MFKLYTDLIVAINNAYRDYAEYSESIGIPPSISPKEFMEIFMDSYEEYFNGEEYIDGENYY